MIDAREIMCRSIIRRILRMRLIFHSPQLFIFVTFTAMYSDKTQYCVQLLIT